MANNTQEEVRTSVSSIYSDLLKKRRAEREEKEAAKAEEKAKRKEEKESKKIAEDGTKLTKKQRREKELDNWKEVIVGLTGDDLEYSKPEKNKKKYRKWIDDENPSSALNQKPKKAKKRNYNKEFEPELNMLRTVLADQNKFNADLQKRFANAAGPATKDAMPPNKTMVELASAIISGRTNSLGMIREIGSIKKTIADLYMKQKKLDSELSGSSGADTSDLGLLGSSIASAMYGDNSGLMQTPVYNQSTSPMDPMTRPVGPTPNVYQATATPTTDQNQPMFQAESFNPETWGGPVGIDIDPQVIYEGIAKTIVVEKSKSTGAMRFKAIRNDNGEELVGCPVPTNDPTKLSINETDMTVRGNFDENYKLVYVA